MYNFSNATAVGGNSQSELSSLDLLYQLLEESDSAAANYSTKFNFDNDIVHILYSANSDYTNSTDLHIGVTTSEGTIVEFDSRGLKRHTSKTSWEQSLVLESVPEAWWDYWDEVLEKVRFESFF